MSRPKNPTWSVPVWAPNAGYPVSADPWSATPTKTAHPGAASVGITPKTAVAAQHINHEFNAASVRDANAKTLLDELVTHTGQLAVLNWQPKIAVGASTNYAAAYSVAGQRWIVVGNTEDLRVSTDDGRTWSVLSPIATVGANENCRSVDVDTNGNAVVGTTSAFVFTFSASDTAAKVSVFAGNTTAIDVVYEPIANLFSALVYDGLSAYLKTSADAGATWTTRTLPSQWADFATFAGLQNLKVAANKLGRLVAVGQGFNNGVGPAGAGTCRAMTSDNGGVTWTDRGTFATTISSPTIGEVSWNPTTSEFMYVIGETSGTPSSEVWTSPDGVTWTKKATLAAAALGKVAPHGSLWAGVAKEGSAYKVVYSTDGGATWPRAGIALDGTDLRGLYAGAGGFLALTANYVYLSLRAGAPALGSLA